MGANGRAGVNKGRAVQIRLFGEKTLGTQLLWSGQKGLQKGIKLRPQGEIWLRVGAQTTRTYPTMKLGFGEGADRAPKKVRKALAMGKPRRKTGQS